MKADIIVRITGDCPLVDPHLVDLAIEMYLNNKVDYVSNINPPTFPDGLDVEVFSIEMLRLANSNASERYEREHVTPTCAVPNFNEALNLSNDIDLSNLRFTLDEPDDLVLINNIYEHFSPDGFGFSQAVEYIKKNPILYGINSSLERNEGSKMSEGQKLWRRAKRLFPEEICCFQKV